MALSDRIISSSKLIHKRLYGKHTYGSDIIRVIYIAPSQRSSEMGISHNVKLTPSGWKSGGQRGITIINAILGIGMEEEGVNDGI
jgi:hypothetical protein